MLLAHPSAELYGSDRMLLESVRALVTDRRVVVTLPVDGELAGEIQAAGAEVVIAPTIVLRRTLLTPRGMLDMARRVPTSLTAAIRLIRDIDAGAVYVNTLTLPVWLLAAFLLRRPSLCHVHEAEDAVHPVIRAGLTLPLRLARVIVVNSRASADALGWRMRSTVIYNGVPGPPTVSPPRDSLDGTIRLVLVGRWSPRKGTDVAVAAVDHLQRDGFDVTLDLVGGVFPGYEWFERRLRAEAGPSVRFVGFRSDVWESFADSDAVLVPSRAEPFGNVAVEAMLAERPVVAAAAQGLCEVIDDGVTGVLVPPDDPDALASAIRDLVTDWARATSLAAAARDVAAERFGVARYRTEIRRTVARLTAAHD